MDFFPKRLDFFWLFTNTGQKLYIFFCLFNDTLNYFIYKLKVENKNGQK